MRRLVAVFIVVAVVGAVSAWLLPTWLYALSVSSERSRSGLRVEEVRIGRAEIP